MNIRLIGALAVIIACGGFGLMLANAYRKQEKSLFFLQRMIGYIENDLSYRATALPDLLYEAGKLGSGCVQEVLVRLANALQSGEYTDAATAMEQILRSLPEVPDVLQNLFRQLGQSLGRFDIDGQLRELKAVSQNCTAVLDDMRLNRKMRIRNYQTLGLCAGLALAILLI